MKINVIADLDGTITDETHRRKLIVDENVEAYFRACARDDPNEDVIETLNVLYKAGFCIHIITGRSESVMAQTRDWLRQNLVKYDTLTMRSVKDYDPNGRSGAAFKHDPDIKERICKRLGLTPTNVMMVLEDREEMVEDWREKGYNCWQVRPRGVFY